MLVKCFCHVLTVHPFFELNIFLLIVTHWLNSYNIPSSVKDGTSFYFAFTVALWF